MKKLLITGVNGFIGRNAAHYFENEYAVHGMDIAARYCEADDRQYQSGTGCLKCPYA